MGYETDNEDKLKQAFNYVLISTKNKIYNKNNAKNLYLYKCFNNNGKFYEGRGCFYNYGNNYGYVFNLCNYIDSIELYSNKEKKSSSELPKLKELVVTLYDAKHNAVQEKIGEFIKKNNHLSNGTLKFCEGLKKEYSVSRAGGCKKQYQSNNCQSLQAKVSTDYYEKNKEVEGIIDKNLNDCMNGKCMLIANDEYVGFNKLIVSEIKAEKREIKSLKNPSFFQKLKDWWRAPWIWQKQKRNKYYKKLQNQRNQQVSQSKTRIEKLEKFQNKGSAFKLAQEAQNQDIKDIKETFGYAANGTKLFRAWSSFKSAFAKAKNLLEKKPKKSPQKEKKTNEVVKKSEKPKSENRVTKKRMSGSTKKIVTKCNNGIVQKKPNVNKSKGKIEVLWNKEVLSEKEYCQLRSYVVKKQKNGELGIFMKIYKKCQSPSDGEVYKKGLTIN